MIRFLIIIFTLLSLTGCTDNTKLENSIIISKIGINRKYSMVSLTDDVNGIVMYEECGRPDKIGSNTVMGAHSGIGSNALFNDISKLETGDLINIIYNNVEYVYSVIEIRVVNDTDTYILDDKDESMLTLLTCKFGDIGKRIIVISKLTIDT